MDVRWGHRRVHACARQQEWLRGFSPDREEAFEGGEMLASFSMPHKPKIIRSKPVIIKPKPKPAALPPLKCVCPHCKLGDEQIGLEDEQHTIAPLSKTKKIEMIDDELMKLDPTYAMKRIGMSDDGTK